MKQQKKFWIRENQSIGIWTFLGCIGACLHLSMFRSSVEDIWRNFYYVEQYYMEISNTAFGRFLSYSRVFYSTMAVYVLILSILLFHNLSRSKTKEWIASLPLKQKDIFWYKFRQGIVAYTLPMLTYGIGSIAIMIFNRGWLITNYLRFADCKIWIANENPLVYVKIIAIMWLWITCVYMMFFFAQVICRNAVLAGLIGYGMYSTTAYLGGFLYIIAQSHHIKSLEKAAFILYRSFSHVLVTMPTGNASLGWSFFDLFGFFTPLNDISGYKIYLPEIAIMAGTFVIFFALSRFYYGRMNHPEVEGLFESKLMRAFILYGFGFCLMFPFVFLFVEGMEYAAQMMSVNIIVGMVPAILIHFLLKRRGY